MKKYLEITLIVIIGLLLGLLIHGVVEILAIWVLTTWFISFFTSIAWGNWLLIHHVLTVIVEILGVFLAFWICKKYWRNKKYG
jgi:hypothetical protein